MDKPKCPYLKETLVGDEISVWCTLADKWCLLEGGYTCDIYEEYLQELVEEETDGLLRK